MEMKIMKSKLLFKVLSFLLTLTLIIPMTVRMNPVNAQTIPESELPLAKKTTESIVAQILDENYYLDVFFLASSDEAYKYWVRNFDEFSELESRVDTSKILKERLQYYEETDSADQDSDVFGKIVLLRVMLNQTVYQNGNNESNLTHSVENQIYETTSLDTTNGGTYLDPLEEMDVALEIDLLDYFIATRTLSHEFDTVNGSPVYLYTTSKNLTQSQINKVNNSIDALYSEDARLATASALYNCHSYAWYSQSSTNPYWIEYADYFTIDPHYELLTTGTAKVGDIVVYRNNNGKITHSAIITDIETSSLFVPIITCASKLGVAGVYVHSITNVPETYYEGSDTPIYEIRHYTTDHSYTGAYYQHNTTYHTRQCAHCTALATFVHVYTVTSYTSTGHTLTCRMCGQTKTEAHTVNAQTGKCTKCAYTGPISSNPILSLPPEILQESCNCPDHLNSAE